MCIGNTEADQGPPQGISGWPGRCPNRLCGEGSPERKKLFVGIAGQDCQEERCACGGVMNAVQVDSRRNRSDWFLQF